MTRVSDIADYLLGTGIGDTEAAWKAEVSETIAARWPDVDEAELTAAFEMVMIKTGTQLIEALDRNLRRAAGIGAPDGR